MLHGLGGSRRSFDTITGVLAGQRELVIPDLPGFGETPPLTGEPTIPALADAVVSFLDEQGLRGADVVGSSMGARLALELARRGEIGATVALDPGGFWTEGQRRAFHASIAASVRLVRLLQPAMPALTGSPVGRTLLCAQLSARPWALPADVLLAEMRSFAAARSFDSVLRGLVHGPAQQGIDLAGELPPPITIGWGRRDLVTLPSQSERALALFPSAKLHWFERCGHFPHWDAPQETVDLILASTGTQSTERKT
jgi:pimeloyl-ACP methyl ester carboxylesterase